MEKVNIERFDELLKGDKPVVCDFYTTWCGPCKLLTPIMEEAAEKYSDKAVFVKVDIDLNIDLAVRYNVTSIPLIGVFKDGKICDKSLGYMAKPDVEAFLKKNLG